MNSVFEKIIEKLEKLADELYKAYCIGFNSDDRSEYDAYINAIEIVKQEAEQFGRDTNVGSNGWIPCSERLPETSGEYLTWVKYDGKEFHSIDEIDCDGIFKEWNCSSDYKIIAWMNLPAPYQPKGE